jgi:NAD+ kinase
VSQKTKINPKQIGVILKPKTVTEYASLLPNLESWLKKRKIKLSFIESEADRIHKIFNGKVSQINFLSDKEMQLENSLNVTLGGDGTLLGFGRHSLAKSAPILGINMGNLGFITEYPKSEFFEALDIVIKNPVEIIKVPLFKASVSLKGKSIFENCFLNDAVINKNDISRMFSLKVECDGQHVYQISGDGLIIGSPIGSTAYTLAAGGPIIHPSVNALCLTPICPHALNHRPLVINDKSHLQIKIPSGTQSIQLTLDGQEFFEVPNRGEIEISKCKSKYLKLIKNPDLQYFQTLKDKFTHGRRN